MTRSRRSSPASRGADPVTRYATAVVVGAVAQLFATGTAPVGALHLAACRRHLEDLRTGPGRGLRFSRPLATWAIDFFRQLSHSKGQWSGQPFALSPWQEFIVGSLYGWRRVDGTRRFRTAYIEVPRKNGKSTLAAGLGLLLGFFDGEAGSETYCAATKKDQAKIVFEECRRMVLKSPGLQRHISALVNNLHAEDTGSKLEPLGADSDSLDGLNLHAAIVDELHAHRTRDLVDVLETATGARRQPLIFYITTAGFNRESVCWEFHQDAAQVLDGLATDDALFAFIAAADPGDDWHDPRTWAKANPNLGVSVVPDQLARLAARAARMPSAQNSFRRRHLNVWTETLERWIELGLWDAAAAPAIDPEALRGRICFGGLDLSSNRDTSAYVLVFPEADGGYVVLPHFWIPRDGMEERVRQDRIAYDAWARDGFLEVTEGNTVDQEVIRQRILQLAERYDVREVAFDRWGANKIVTELQQEGATMIGFGQGYQSMAAPTLELERLLLDGKLRHGGHPVLRWQAGNMSILEDPAGNRKPNKTKTRYRIDGMVALLMALGRAMVNGQAPSAYGDHGLVVV